MAVSSIFASLMRLSGRPALNSKVNLYPHAIEIIERGSAVGTTGQVEAADEADEAALWVVFATALAKVAEQTGSEYPVDVDNVQGGETVTLEMLFVEGVKDTMRLRYDGREWGILATWSPGGRGVYTRIVARTLEIPSAEG